jgi:hypothetical protein
VDNARQRDLILSTMFCGGANSLLRIRMNLKSIGMRQSILGTATSSQT